MISVSLSEISPLPRPNKPKAFRLNHAQKQYLSSLKTVSDAPKKRKVTQELVLDNILQAREKAASKKQSDVPTTRQVIFIADIRFD
ncbi:hypothetical protein GUITHDRAFT_102845 [Guillardia theta CCMP2712]|uniref:Uncharacterized protein n=1 Tax=Guillardia theta (strain CCMP2712) TaxID=905079 RepID=L1JTD4_GUITC|nr:hypothetical protein GUITHDRAFT_102845 [Guillardia theta CCMP2712]EKX51584.1 hypothetical protein GUITHDRAFT_102845 [Guillardia theta CCMP2712]|mmetsp:Transcript_1457/g.4412  ORF Transcript_1457/g.4412 Transcript_1457/m.4412 type:complete len:86 (+) Transcript_1457:176-433(+)|eukprot:XP_005838564.1 hypothetical protein GUITHDRAFT_102845 [Guillardia theta CCMP2712]